MQVRTQLAIVALVALGWGGGNYVRVHPVMDQGQHAADERMTLAALEQTVARHPDDVTATRVLLHRYLDLGMPQLVVDTVHRAPGEVQRDGVVCLHAARAHEALGNVATGNAVVAGAQARCGTLPDDLGEAVGCDVRPDQLAIEGAALDRMIQWHVTPVSDPVRASVAHELATRPVRLAASAPSPL